MAIRCDRILTDISACCWTEHGDRRLHAMRILLPTEDHDDGARQRDAAQPPDMANPAMLQIGLDSWGLFDHPFTRK